MPVVYARLDLKRQLRDKMGMFFIVALPAFLFLVFGMGDDEPYGSANVAMYVMVSMAAYGAVTATTTVVGAAATEQTMGWGRQVALTPLAPLAFVAIKTGVAMLVAAVPIALIYAIGAATGSAGNAVDWLATAAIVWLGSALFAVYGLAVCLVFKGENATGIASGLIVIMSFLGNVFTPMDGFMLELGRFTPLYGYAGLARYPITDGYLPMGAEHDSLWLLLANVGAWTVIFAAVAVWALRRRRERV
jgi:ABC-2 type transport system permease protein